MTEAHALSPVLEEIQRPSRGHARRPPFARRSPLAEPQTDFETRQSRSITSLRVAFCFGDRRWRIGIAHAGAIEIFQMNLGRFCNMTCRHCHVDAGPTVGVRS